MRGHGLPFYNSKVLRAVLSSFFAALQVCYEICAYRVLFPLLNCVWDQVQGGMRVIKGLDGVIADTLSLSTATKAASSPNARPTRYGISIVIRNEHINSDGRVVWRGGRRVCRDRGS